jgi:hypothetical protein
MTAALTVYAATFMRYALAVTPANYLLFACHLTNFGAQTTQGYRYLAYWKYVSLESYISLHTRSPLSHDPDHQTDHRFLSSWGGREAKLAEQAKKGKQAAEAGA